MKVLLKNIAKVRAGHPFRGGIAQNNQVNEFVIQIKNVDDDGVIDWSNLTKTKLLSKREPRWLKMGDVVFISRGSRKTAAAINIHSKRTVCSQHFFVITVTSDAVEPEFLAWQLNQSSTQSYFRSSAEGSLQLSIRRRVLEHTPLTLPALEEQRKIMAAVKCALKEKRVYLKLIENRQQQLAAITQNLLK